MQRRSLPEFLDGEEGHYAAIIVAAGLADDDLLWASVAGKPLLAWTVDVFERSALIGEVALVVPRGRLDDARALWLAEDWRRISVIAAGGATRRESVYVGLQALTAGAQRVIVHEGARPLVTEQMLAAGVQVLARCDAASACEPVAETIKRTRDGVVVETPDRASLVQLQTPQVFDYATLLDLHERADDSVDARDDATMALAMGVRVMTFPGGPDNIAVTTAEDLALVEALLAGRWHPKEKWRP